MGAKRLCILTLTKIFVKTHGFQSLVREITTPRLPDFITSCLNLIIVKGSTKPREASPALLQTIVDSFSALVPRHPTIFRSFLKPITHVCRPNIAPTTCDGRATPTQMQQSCQRLTVLMHQTAPKNTSAEEWSKAVRKLVLDAQETADQVLRSVIEDWESSTGYAGNKVDVEDDCHGGHQSEDSLSAWTGVSAGMQRLRGLLSLLAEYFKYPTAMAVTVPLAQIEDLLSRLMSVAAPRVGKSSTSLDGVRIHPGIDRTEREQMFVALPQIQVAAVHVYMAMIARFESKCIRISLDCLSHLLWLFPSVSADSQFRLASYTVLQQILPIVGSSLPKHIASGCNVVIRSCVADCLDDGTNGKDNTRSGETFSSTSAAAPGPNADTMLRNDSTHQQTSRETPSLTSKAAQALLPLLISHLPQKYVDGKSRATMDRAAVLTQNRDALLASVLCTSVASNGRVLPSLAPHLSRTAQGSLVNEALFRPRFPLIPQHTAAVIETDASHMDDESDAEEDPEVEETGNQLQEQSSPVDTLLPVDPTIGVPPEPTLSIPYDSKALEWPVKGPQIEDRVTTWTGTNPPLQPDTSTPDPPVSLTPLVDQSTVSGEDVDMKSPARAREEVNAEEDDSDDDMPEAVAELSDTEDDE